MDVFLSEGQRTPKVPTAAPHIVLLLLPAFPRSHVPRPLAHTPTATSILRDLALLR